MPEEKIKIKPSHNKLFKWIS